MSVIVNPARKLVALLFSYIEQKSKYGIITKSVHSSQKKLKGTVVNVTTYWRPMTWGDHVSMLSKSTIDNNLNMIKYRDLKLKMSLKRIVCQEDSILITDDVIDSMDANIAEDLLNLYEKTIDTQTKELDDLTVLSKEFFEGKKLREQIPPCVYESVIASHYNWDLNTIRAMDYTDMQSHLRMCIVREELERDFQLALAGAKPKTGTGLPSIKAGAKVVTKKLDPSTGIFV